ncbi:HlyD family type I secretion periplasmic adaptor subunit [Ruegeria sp. Ofav3-42]|uniref:HlyD family type I secretion periplasmic adaptor subunit n=1 Tax=Ruegeria sp. Ofav3-42 TaxID=2917759 RepID=UPI001EF5810B|nr:HlyD family type I secretion periplasmic adaptor subunit [Ruegeria sp. Ofav3-42]MCG7521940.1 HlyD family type I secretion periplasmic adaptor subunit [Ruegeria sp. Ofav3-42]
MVAIDGQGPKLKTSTRWPGLIGMVAAFTLVAGGAWWASTTEISGAVIALGSVEVQGRPKAVQHLDGGIIDRLHVRDGDPVQKGDVLVELDDTLLKANMAIYKTRLSEALALRDRLVAEQTDAVEIANADLDPLLDEIAAQVHRAGQQQIFQARRDLESGRKEQLSEKIRQFQNQTKGVDGLIDSKERQLSYIHEEIAALAVLTGKGLAPASQLRSLQRNEADLLGQIAEHKSELARIQNSIRDTELEMLQGQRQTKEEVVTQLRETITSIQELRQQILTTSKQLDRVDIRAPNSGRVHEMQFSTIGGVVPPGGLILQVVPLDEGFVLRTRIDPSAVDQVYIGQPAKVRFSAFNQRTTPELVGTVADVSASTSVDEATGQSFYWVTVSVEPDELAKLGNQELVPGMPVETYLTTSDRTIISYLSKPLFDQVNQAFREE